MPPHVPPAPASLHHLRARNSTGAAFAGLALLLTSGGIWLSLSDAWTWWLTGQLLLAAAFVQWLALLHECGHSTLFASRALNRMMGHLAGCFALIPFGMWTHVHRLHHKWTGWQDLDPTTAGLTPRPRSLALRVVVNVAWRLWLPIFSIVYRLSNFWDPLRLKRDLSSGVLRWTVVFEAAVLFAIYALIAFALGGAMTVRLFGLALALAFVVEDLLILSQHTHVPMELSGGREVTPHRALEQERYTRSLRLPAPVSRLLLHVDAHELHHMYPFVPGYALRHVDYDPANEVGWWTWVRGARAIPGDVLLFQNRRDTGLTL